MRPERQQENCGAVGRALDCRHKFQGSIPSTTERRCGGTPSGGGGRKVRSTRWSPATQWFEARLRYMRPYLKNNFFENCKARRRAPARYFCVAVATVADDSSLRGRGLIVAP